MPRGDRPDAKSGFWNCGRCGVPNPGAAYVTVCVACGAARTVPRPVPVARPTLKPTRKPWASRVRMRWRPLSRGDRYVLALTCAYAGLALLLVAVRWGAGGSWSIGTQLVLLASLPLAGLSLWARRPGLIAINVASVLLMLLMFVDSATPERRPGRSRAAAGAVARASKTTESTVPAGFFYGVIDNGKNQGELLRIDAGSGRAVSLGKPLARTPQDAIEALEDIVVAPDGTLLAEGYSHNLTNGQVNHAGLFRINPATMTSEYVGVTLDYQFIEGLAFVGETLYGSASTLGGTHGLRPSYGIDISDHLVTIDPATGQATEVGLFGPEFLNVESIAWSPTHGLVGVDIGTLVLETEYQTFHTKPALIRIDPHAADRTHLATKIADLPPREVKLVRNSYYANKPSPEGPYMCGLRFGPDGETLYASAWPTHFGGESHLVTIDPTTGEVTDIGPMGVDGVDGLAHIPAPPEAARARP